MSWSALATWLGALQLVGLAVMVIAVLAVRGARRRSASARRSLWALAVMVLLSLPIARVALDVGVLALPRAVSIIVVGVWALGFGVSMLRHAYALRSARALVERSRPLGDRRWLERVRASGLELELRSLDEGASPMIVGCVRPVILIPRALLDIDDDERRSLLAHELAHVARADNLLLHAAVLARSIYWINPLSWSSLRWLRREVEAAADDAALEAGAESASYAALLLGLGRGLGRGVGPALRERIEAVLDRERRRGCLAEAPRARLAFARLVGAAVLLASLATACEARSDTQVVSERHGAVAGASVQLASP